MDHDMQQIIAIGAVVLVTVLLTLFILKDGK